MTDEYITKRFVNVDFMVPMYGRQVVEILRQLAAEVREMQMTLPERIERTIRQTVSALGGDVVRIMYRLRDDSYGEPAVFFQVLLSDAAGKRENLRGVTEQVNQLLHAQDFIGSNGAVSAYVNFRTVSEQDKLQDPEWEAQ